MKTNSFHILTFGCQMNVHDSLWLHTALTKRNFSETELALAQVIIINTCSVRAKPERKLQNTLDQLKQYGDLKERLIVVTGCVAQQLGSDLLKHPAIRLVVGTDAFANIPNLVEELLEDKQGKIALLDFSKEWIERKDGQYEDHSGKSYVTIMQGCDNFCAYCIVPYTRGRQKSRTSTAILQACQEALANGAREICLLGQNVNAFGKDACGDGTSFSQLLRSVANLPDLVRLYYLAAHPRDMQAEDIQLFAELPQLLPRLHLPLQAGSDQVLKRMRRGHSQEQFLALVAKLRQARPDLALSTDLIVGFPGETEADFQQTLEMLTACNFMASYSFCYSDRPGTQASKFLDKIAPDIQQDRLQRLQELQEKLSQQWLERRVNTETEILIEGQSKREISENLTNIDIEVNQSSQAKQEQLAESNPKIELMKIQTWQGRDPYGIAVHVALNLPNDFNLVGRILPVRIIKAKKHSLIAEKVGELW